MKNIFVIFLIFSFSALFADQWDGFFKETGFPRKIIDNNSLVKGKLYDAVVTYQIKNNDGIKGNFQNNDSAKIVVTNKKGTTISTDKYMDEKELRVWAKTNFVQIFSLIVGDSELNKEKLKELTNLASLVLLNKNLE